MDAQIVTSIICGLLLAVGVLGTIIPVLPGPLLIIAALLIWALVLANPVGWIVFAIGTLLAVVGMLASAVLTGRRLRERKIPSHSIVIGLVCGVAGMFLIPVVGLILGFMLGLFLSESARQRDFSHALSSSWAALKATGVGILVAFTCASLAGTAWIIGVWIHFATR
jgi:uncharacterized protein